MKTAENIVRALATTDEPYDTGLGHCRLCGAFRHPAYPEDIKEHAAECPYRMAREWVEGHEQKPPPTAWRAVEQQTRVEKQEPKTIIGTASPAESAVDAVIADLQGRRGLRHEWDGIDKDVRSEIRATWIDIINQHQGIP